MEDKKFSFEGLEVYQVARCLVKEVYLLQSKFPKTETFALGDQIRRSASSITSNIAEGSGRIIQLSSQKAANCRIKI